MENTSVTATAPAQKRKYICKRCGKNGHNIRTCQEKKVDTATEKVS